jgi:hypothetical protein
MCEKQGTKSKSRKLSLRLILKSLKKSIKIFDENQISITNEMKYFWKIFKVTKKDMNNTQNVIIFLLFKSWTKLLVDR